jgi:hypothetical protein
MEYTNIIFLVVYTCILKYNFSALTQHLRAIKGGLDEGKNHQGFPKNCHAKNKAI